MMRIPTALVSLRRLAAVVAALAIALAGCSTLYDPPPSLGPGPATLVGTSWRVVNVAGRAPVAAARPTAMFTADRVTGSGGCNTYGGRYRYDPATGRIEFGEMGMTAMACLEAPRNDFETAYVQTLAQANLVTVDAQGVLTLSGPGGVIVLELDPQRAVEG
jgi:heat shock protein HslJ